MADPHNMSIQELEALIKARRSEEATKLAKQGVKIRGEVEAYVKKKYNLTLAQIFTASDKERATYKNPNGDDTYSGRGKPPKWYMEMTPQQREEARV